MNSSGFIPPCQQNDLPAAELLPARSESHLQTGPNPHHAKGDAETGQESRSVLTS